MPPEYADIAKMIDHSLLQPHLTVSELESGIDLAKTYQVASVCILPWYVNRCADLLQGSGVVPSTTIGFPHGGHRTSTKVAEAEQAIADGCQELDMVVNISQVLSHRWEEVRSDIGAVINVAHASQRRVKVIFENCYLQEEHKIRLCEICGELNADWVKTSTGYGTSGALPADIQLMRQHSPSHVQVKAAGGIRNLEGVLEMRSLGATRIGASRTREILEELRSQLRLAPLSSSHQPAIGGY